LYRAGSIAAASAFTVTVTPFTCVAWVEVLALDVECEPQAARESPTSTHVTALINLGVLVIPTLSAVESDRRQPIAELLSPGEAIAVVYGMSRLSTVIYADAGLAQNDPRARPWDTVYI